MSKIFISYRREDTPGISKQIFQSLCDRFGNHDVYIDVATIPKGVRYDDHIKSHIKDAPVFLELIGPNWNTEADQQGKIRLHERNDMLRNEIATAMRLGIPIIPVFINIQDVPAERLLPNDIKPIVKFNGVFIQEGDFAIGMRDLIEAIEPYIDEHGFHLRIFDEVNVLVPPLLHIPGGSFMMGNDANENEMPAHQINLPDYYIAQFPVTVEEYELYLKATKHAPPPANSGVFWAGQLKHDNLRHPVVNVSWQDAVDYANWLAKVTGQKWRLPSEAEWEKAARGTEGFTYPWGNEWDPTRANTVENGPQAPTKVRSYPRGKSPFGVFDMVGNVWEWTASLNKPYADKAHTRYDDLQVQGQRIRRGGSWLENMSFARTTKRLSDDPGVAKPNLGFRLALG